MQSFEHNHVNVFTVPIEKNNRLQGKLVIYSKHNGKKFQALYEDWSSVDLVKGGNIIIQNLEKREIAQVNLVRKEDKGYIEQIINVLNVPQAIRLRSDTVEWPTSDDGWWDCTTRCFKLAKDACGSDPQCNFLCEIADLPLGCTISVAVACGIYCM
jgi:hypothetical protein